MIKVNSTAIATPSTYLATLQDITKAFRNTNGDMYIERVTTKRKLEMSWNYLSQADLSTLLTAIKSGGATVDGTVSNVFFNVEYLDPEDGALKTGIFYVGDRSAEAIDYISNTIRWKGVKFNFIER